MSNTRETTGAAAPASDPSDADPAALEASRRLIEQDQEVQARAKLNDVLLRGDLSPDQAAKVRRAIGELNQRLIFSEHVAADDPYTKFYKVQPGDTLEKIGKRFDTGWQLVQRINGGIAPKRLRVGARLKVIRGPIHVRLQKAEYRLDLYLGRGDERLYVTSFEVGLGQPGWVPNGRYTVSNRVTNIEWIHPRTGKRYSPEDPENPTGEHWLGLRSVDGSESIDLPLGLHGTIAPETIGERTEGGYVRLRTDAIERLFGMLRPGKSEVVVVD